MHLQSTMLGSQINVVYEHVLGPILHLSLLLPILVVMVIISGNNNDSGANYGIISSLL
jgi:hypothetical protein